MSRNDDDDLIPAPDAEASASERAHAKTFAELVDKALVGRTPAAMSADDRALLEVATVIRAGAGNAELAPHKRSSIIEGALAQAVGVAKAAPNNVIDIARKRPKAPWIIAAASLAVAAAAIILWLSAPRHVVEVRSTAQLPETWKSRPTDSLIGPIAREHAGDAISRIDTIFADRLDGYREIRLRGKP